MRRRLTEGSDPEVEYWALYWSHEEELARIRFEGWSQLLIAACAPLRVLGFMGLVVLGLLLVAMDHTSAVDVQKVLGVAVTLGGTTTLARHQRPSTGRRQRRRK
jgi:hypothetical protein